MMSDCEFQKDMSRYVVVKREDVEKHLSEEEISTLSSILEKIAQKRKDSGKNARSYVCVSDNCPHYDAVWALVQDWWRTRNL